MINGVNTRLIEDGQSHKVKGGRKWKKAGEHMQSDRSPKSIRIKFMQLSSAAGKGSYRHSELVVLRNRIKTARTATASSSCLVFYI